MEPLIINFCPTGMVPTKADNPNIPISPSEIIEQTHQAYEIGITIVHIHARGADQRPTHEARFYRQIIEGIRKHCPGLLISASSSGRNVKDFNKRSEVIELQPDLCSLTLSSLNFVQQASINEPDIIMGLAEKMKQYEVVPELEAFDLGMVNYGQYLIKKGIIQTPCYWNLIFGNIAGWQGNMSQMAAAVESIPSGHFIAFGGLGQQQLRVHATAIANGYGVRVGLEDNLWWDEEKTQLASNIGLLKRVHELAKVHSRPLMDGIQLKDLWKK
jgi:3-keto-5-aminohexanoate cleavage enzyme